METYYKIFLQEIKEHDWNYIRDNYENVVLIFTTYLFGFLGKDLQKQIIKFILENGSDINFQDEDGKTALHYATKNSDEDIVEFLLQNKADPNIKNKYGNSAIDVATKNSDEHIICYSYYK